MYLFQKVRNVASSFVKEIEARQRVIYSVSNISASLPISAYIYSLDIMRYNRRFWMMHNCVPNIIPSRYKWYIRMLSGIWTKVLVGYLTLIPKWFSNDSNNISNNSSLISSIGVFISVVQTIKALARESVNTLDNFLI